MTGDASLAQPQRALVLAVKSPPYFERVIKEGLANNWLTQDAVLQYAEKAPNAIVQLAQYFSTPHLRPALEKARVLLVHAVSLGLEHTSNSNVRTAAGMLHAVAIAKHSKVGFDLGRALAKLEWLDDHGTKQYLEHLFVRPISLAAYKAKLSALQSDNDFLGSL